MAAKKRGRPPKAKKDLASQALLVRLTPVEKKALEAAAKREGIGLADYFRRAAAYCDVQRVPLAHVTTGPLPPGMEVE